MSDTTQFGQGRVISEVRRLVDRWRGFSLGTASESYADLLGGYEPRAAGERPLSDTSRTLLSHWFRREPHTVGGLKPALFRYWPHQRRAVETLVYLHEVRGIRRTEALYALAGVDPLGPQRDPWAKLGGQLATGSGKTKVMSLLIAWAYLNAVRENGAALGFGRHAVVIAPGLFVRDRLLQDFAPERGGGSVFVSDPVVPPEYEADWNLKVYTPTTCPLELDPAEGALVVTNRHQLFREDDQADTFDLTQEELLFASPEPRRLEDISTPLLQRFRRSRGLLVINDEAHGVKDEPEHARLEQKQQAGDEAMSWIRAIRRLNGDEQRAGRVTLQVDLSATLFEETGSERKASGGKQRTEFKPADLFRHTAMHYGLAEAIKDGIVKRPVLERIEVRDRDTDEPLPLVREGAPNAFDKYKNLLVTGIERWKKVRDQFRDEGDHRKPILFVLCDNRDEAREVANTLAFGEPSREDLKGRKPTGWVDPDGERLFLENGLSTVIEIHIGEKEQRNEVEWEHVRQAVNAIDSEEIPDPLGATGPDGRVRMIANPYNVVVSVMMLKEGWDVRNVKVIVPLRPCDSRTLTEQTLGRGLRKMHPPLLDEEGGATLQREELFVMEHPSFDSVIKQIEDLVERKASDQIEHVREYVAITRKEDEADVQKHSVRLVSFDGTIDELQDWRAALKLDALRPIAPRLAWAENLSTMEIQTYLQRALISKEERGQHFEFDDAPSFRDFDHVIEVAYALPLLREMRAAYHHKNGVKAVVRNFLERNTFATPKGIPVSFDRVVDAASARIALGNLAREEVIEAVRKALVKPLHEALTSARRLTRARLTERSSADVPSHQALKKCVVEHLARSSFSRAALGNADEVRVARLLDAARDVEGWLYNDRDVGYFMEYEWQGYTSRYHPDFVARARIGSGVHNFVIEVKGRYDDRDKAKARRGREYCELLTQHDREPWHYVLLLENEPLGRADISWWEEQSVPEVGHLYSRQERLPLLPLDEGTVRIPLEVVDDVAPERKFSDAAPVYDLMVAAGAFGTTQEPEAVGWARVQASRGLDRRMFVARIAGRSMERDIPDGAWGLFRAFPVGEEPQAGALDGRRLLVQLRDAGDPEHGGKYTLKRWRVHRDGPGAKVSSIELRPDNPAFSTLRIDALEAVRVVAEFLEVVG